MPRLEQKIRFCTTRDGVRLAHATLGRGPPLVKAANWLGHLQFDLESPVFRHWTRELSRYHQYVRYDDRGCGLSDWNVKSSSFQDWVHDLETVVDSVGLDKFALLGMSHGGAVSIAYAALHPERVTHLILYGASALGWAKIHTSPEDVEMMNALLTLTRVAFGKNNLAFHQVFTSLFIPDGTPEKFQWFNELHSKSTSPENAAKFMVEFAHIDVRDLLAKVSVPTLVLHARGDLVNRFEDGRDLATLVSGAHFVPLESRNHLLLEDEPAWGRFLVESRRFLGVKESDLARPRGEKELGIKTWLKGPKE